VRPEKRGALFILVMTDLLTSLQKQDEL